MKQYFSTSIGRLRAIGFLEGISLLLLLLIAMPVKYLLGEPALVRSVGMAHGVLFLLFVFYSINVGLQRRWAFSRITWKLLLASVIPFGTFYVDRKILSRLPEAEAA
jgi:integral membrane protein